MSRQSASFQQMLISQPFCMNQFKLRVNATRYFQVSLFKCTQTKSYDAYYGPAGVPPCTADSRPTKRPRSSGNSASDAGGLPLKTAEPPKQSRQNKKQCRTRAEKIIRNGYRASSAITQKHLNNSRPIQTSIETAKFPVAYGAYTALNKPSPPKIDQTLSVQELQELGFQYIAIDPKKR